MNRSTLTILLVLILFFSWANENFFTVSNFLNILSASSIVGLLSLGLAFVIATGGIDLSVGSILALSSVLTASYVLNVSDDLLTPLIIASIVGIGAGLINGFLITLTRAPSFIVTLGTLSIYRSACFIFTDATPIYGLPDGFLDAYQKSLLGIPVGVYIFVILVSLAAVGATKMRLGRHLQLYGDSPTAAKAVGISPNAINLAAFTISGFFAGVAGFLFTLKTNSGDPAAGVSYELIAITAVVLGGARLFGGPISIAGTFLGTLLIGILQNGLNLYGVSTYYQILFVGLVLIIAGSRESLIRGRRE